jgi:MtN3 and saliva related transmembrane protein
MNTASSASAIRCAWWQSEKLIEHERSDRSPCAPAPLRSHRVVAQQRGRVSGASPLIAWRRVTTALAIAAATWGVAMAASPLLQIRRIFQRGSSRDVSLSAYGVLLVGFVLWIAYGVALGNAALIVPNSVALAVAVTAVVVVLRYRG